ncbi:MAG: lysozyme [Pseudomonadota bacterium]
MSFERKIVFDAVRRLRGDKPFTDGEVRELNAAIDRALTPEQPRPAARRIGPKGLALIKRFEGLRLNAYKCPADVATIGYGSTGQHVRMGMTITEAEAEKLLLDDLDRFERGVVNLAGTTTAGQFSACVSLSFNVGLGAFATSTLLKKHLAGDYQGAADQFLRWNRAGNKALAGLTARREAERALYLGK